MRIVSYNILEGGRGRTNAILDIIEKQRPNVVAEHPGQRVDFIFTWGMDRGRLRSAWIECGEPAKDASDHFPVGADVH